MRRSDPYSLALCALFAALIAAGAFLRVPVPVVPFTLQFLFAALAGLLLGGRLGLCAVLLYLFMGLVGLPVFAEGGGLFYVLKPSFGYLIGFAVGAYVTGRVAHGVPAPSFRRLLGAAFLGLALVYFFGMTYYAFLSAVYLGTPIGLWPLFLYGFLLAVPGDIALCFLAAALSKRFLPHLNLNRR